MCLSIKLLSLLLIGPLGAWAQLVAHSPATSRTLESFIPPQYQELNEGRATGDLNGDGRPDIVLGLGPIAEDTASDTQNLPPRLLLVLFQTPTGYALADSSRQVLLCKSCGGQYDPLNMLAIEKKILVVDQMGGNTGRWSVTSKFRYQQGGFYLIGETKSYNESSRRCPYKALVDSNFLTGAYETATTNQNCKELVKRGHRPPLALRKLAEYEPSL